MGEATTGRCLCGALRYSAPAHPLWTCLCHCESCRRAASAPVVAWMGFDATGVSWTGARAFYASSPHVTRSFCPACGTQMSFESQDWPGELHLYAASLEDPARFQPQMHCHHAEHLGWLEITDDLPRYAQTAEDES
ncbi:GFA family protein [Roseobacteraceae bacterium S113]